MTYSHIGGVCDVYTMTTILCRLSQSLVMLLLVCLVSSRRARITDLLDVSVAQNDGLPGHICRKCKRKLERLEKAAEELDNFSSEAKHSYSTLAPFLEGNRHAQGRERSSDPCHSQP